MELHFNFEICIFDFARLFPKFLVMKAIKLKKIIKVHKPS